MTWGTGTTKWPRSRNSTRRHLQLYVVSYIESGGNSARQYRMYQSGLKALTVVKALSQTRFGLQTVAETLAAPTCNGLRGAGDAVRTHCCGWSLRCDGGLLAGSDFVQSDSIQYTKRISLQSITKRTRSQGTRFCSLRFDTFEMK